MGIYLNQNNIMFQEVINSEIYIDKTMLIGELNRMICTSDKYVCISRPRRFGKSMAANMLTAYYSRGCDSRELFAPYKIAQAENFEKHLNKYNVVHLTMTDFAEYNVSDAIKRITRILKKEILRENPSIDFTDDEELFLMFQDVFDQTLIPFVFIIDEWDIIMRKTQQNEQEQKDYLSFLRTLLKDKSYVALAYMTGILPVKKYGEQSALNSFHEYSMEDAYPFSEFTGFTEEETEKPIPAIPHYTCRHCPIA